MGMGIAERVRALLQRRVVRFLLTGAYNTLFGYVAFLVLFHFLGGALHYNVVLVISYVVAVTNSYLLQRRFVFGSTGGWVWEYLRFNVVNAGGLAINMGLLTLLMNTVTSNVAIAQAVCSLATTAFLYVGHLAFSFGTGRGGAGDDRD